MEPGSTTRQILEITHMGSQTTPYRMYTADWVFLPDGSLTFYDALAVGSCRPWVALESRELSLAPNLKKRFRFEIAVPKDAKPGECRFAVMIEGKDLKVNAGDAASFPAAARIGVIVYATVGNGAPVLEVMGAAVERIDGKLVPALEVRNTGNAHGRLGGILDAIDATGAKFELSPATLPILPGEMRRISLTAAPEDKAGEKPVFPVTVKGSLEWADKKTRVDQVFNAR